MTESGFTRRTIISAGGAIAAAASMLGRAEAASLPPTLSSGSDAFSKFSRYKPSFGGPPDSDHYLGKLVPGLRKSGLPPVPVQSPDLGKLPFKLVNGVKEFHLRAMPVKQEFLPGAFMNVWGYNGRLPGPTIEVFQGDRVRIVVQNDLPEATALHWHGFELPVQMDGVPHLLQDPIEPGKSFVYEFDIHQTGTFFYHSHMPMQEGMGMAGLFICHPKIAFDPPVDRDFALVYQNFFILPNSETADVTKMDWNWSTINGKSGPYTTPLLVKHGERVRVRLMNFSPMQHHPIHFHGHSFWLTGTEAGRIPSSAWTPRNNTLVGVAMVQDFEFIANNPGDWIFHCHMVHHMMNHMVRQVGPRIRGGMNLMNYTADIDRIPEPKDVLGQRQFQVPGYPESMQGMMMSDEMLPERMQKIKERKETRGMRPDWYKGVHGLMTVLRVLPEDLYDKVMNSKVPVAPGEIHEAIVRGNYKKRT